MLTIDESDHRELTIAFFYLDEDENWHRNVHENGGTAAENIKDSLHTLRRRPIFEVRVGDELAAFFSENGTIIQSIEGFHVAKKFRTKEFLTEFWRVIFSRFVGDILIGLYESNPDAINHVIRQGFIQDGTVAHNGKKVIILLKRQ